MASDKLKNPSREDLERRIASTREALRAKADGIANELRSVRNSVDVPAKVRNQPLKSFGLAIVAGGLLGFFVKRRGVARATLAPAPGAGLGFASLVALGGSLIKPALSAAAKELIARTLDGPPKVESSPAIGGGTANQSGPIYHS